MWPLTAPVRALDFRSAIPVLVLGCVLSRQGYGLETAVPLFGHRRYAFHVCALRSPWEPVRLADCFKRSRVNDAPDSTSYSADDWREGTYTETAYIENNYLGHENSCRLSRSR